MAEFGIDPGRADDEGAVGVMLEGQVFAAEFGSAVSVDGAGAIGLF